MVITVVSSLVSNFIGKLFTYQLLQDQYEDIMYLNAKLHILITNYNKLCHFDRWFLHRCRSFIEPFGHPRHDWEDADGD